MKSPVDLLSSLLDDVKILEPDVKGLDRDIITIKSRFEHEGYGFLSVALSTLCDAFDQGISTGCFTCPTSFAKTKGRALPKLFQGLLCKVFDPKTGLLLDSPSLHAVKCVREVLRLFKKIKLQNSRVIKLHDEAVAKFLETDAFIQTFEFEQNKINLLRDVCKLVLPNLDGFDSTQLAYKHGPGGVAEGVSSNQKWSELISQLSDDVDLTYHLGLDLSVYQDRPGAFDYPEDDIAFRNAIELSRVLPPSSNICLSSTARLVTVPKDATSLRTITVEPVLKQYQQQGLNTLLRDNINKCSVLRQSLALLDQKPNQKLAMIGSITDEYATIDLSSASDLLSVSLVKMIFASKPVFLKQALDCRSESVDTGKGIVHVLKFAGMGNALTFPVQSVTFALLAICAVLCEEGKAPSYVNVKRAAKHVRVFGDDIIVKTSHAHRVVNWLTSFGLKVNQKKSFLKGNFKESCGVDAYKGVDVTPIYLRHEPIVTARNPEQIASLVATSNLLWARGLYRCANLLRSEVDAVLPLPLVSKQCSALGWHSRVDTSVAHKWDEKLQRLVFRAWTIVPEYRKDRLDGYAALLKSLSELTNSDKVGCSTSSRMRIDRLINPRTIDVKHLQRSVKRFSTRIVRRWVPAEAGSLS
jgi:hypothetical protein